MKPMRSSRLSCPLMEREPLDSGPDRVNPVHMANQGKLDPATLRQRRSLLLKLREHARTPTHHPGP